MKQTITTRAHTTALHVETREGKTHGLPAPPERGSKEDQALWHDTVAWAQLEKAGADWGAFLTMLRRYAPKAIADKRSGHFERVAKRIGGWDSISDIAAFVKTDKPIDGFLLAQRWLQSVEAEQLPGPRGFIDEEVRLPASFLNTLEDDIEKCFDEKYYWAKNSNRIRPSEMLEDLTGCGDLGSYNFAGHPEAPAGHGCIAFHAYRFLSSRYRLSQDQDEDLLTFFYLIAMARTGVAHYPDSNVAYAPK